MHMEMDSGRDIKARRASLLGEHEHSASASPCLQRARRSTCSRIAQPEAGIVCRHLYLYLFSNPPQQLVFMLFFCSSWI